MTVAVSAPFVAVWTKLLVVPLLLAVPVNVSVGQAGAVEVLVVVVVVVVAVVVEVPEAVEEVDLRRSHPDRRQAPHRKSDKIARLSIKHEIRSVEWPSAVIS